MVFLKTIWSWLGEKLAVRWRNSFYCDTCYKQQGLEQKYYKLARLAAIMASVTAIMMFTFFYRLLLLLEKFPHSAGVCFGCFDFVWLQAISLGIITFLLFFFAPGPNKYSSDSNQDD